MEEKKAAEEFRRRQHAGAHPALATTAEIPSTVPPTQIQPHGLQLPPPLYQPPPPEVNSSRMILHFDADCFYAQCEELRDLSLRERPLGVTQKFLVVTCNYVARARGVTKLMSIKEALHRCQDLVLINGEDLTPYRHASKNMISVLKRYGTVQKLGLDEIFVDVTATVETRLLQSVGVGSNDAIEFTGHVHIPGKLHQDNKYRPMDLRADTKWTSSATPADSSNDAAKLQPTINAPRIDSTYTTTPWWPRIAIASIIAREARHAVKVEAGLRTSAGISCNKLLSKLSSGLHKPDDQTLLLPCYAAEFVAPLPVRALPSVGVKLEAELVALGVDTVGSLKNISHKQLLTKFGERTGQFLSLARWGKDDSEVIEQGPPKSITVEDSFRSCRGYSAAKQVLQVLSPDLVARLQEEEEENNRRPTKLIVKWRVKGQGWHRTSASCAFPVAALTSWEELEKISGQVLAANVKEPFDLTLISIGGTGFVDRSGSGGSGHKNDNERSIADMLLGGVQQPEKQEQPVQNHTDALPSSSPSQATNAGLSLKRRRDFEIGADQVPLSKHAERMLRQGGGSGGGNSAATADIIVGINDHDGLIDDDINLWDDLAGLNDPSHSKQHHQRTGSRNGIRKTINAGSATATDVDRVGGSTCSLDPSLTRRVIIHCDIDSFYCSVERLDDPALRNVPLAVEQFNSGGFVAVSYEARAAGIRCGDGAGAAGRAVIPHLAAMKARSVEECRAACPGLVVRGMRPQRYREAGRAVNEMLKCIGGSKVEVEKASCDDFYLDITSLCSNDGCLDDLKDYLDLAASFPSNTHQSPPDGLKFIDEDQEEEQKEEKNAGNADNNIINNHTSVWSNISPDLQRGIWIAHSIRQSLFQKLGLTASCAVSRNKLISRVASPVNKPNGLTLVTSEAAAVKFIGAIPVNRILSMQRKFGVEVQETLQVHLVKDLVKFEKKDLEARFGPSRGKFLSDLPAAIDETPVAERGPPKSITSERSFPPMKNQEAVLSILKNLVEQLLLRGAEDFAEHCRLPIKLGIGFRLGYDTNLVSRSGSVPLEILNWLRSSVNSASFCDGAVDAIEVASSAVMGLLKGATNGRWDITRAAVVLHYPADTSNNSSRPDQQRLNGPTIGELFKAAQPMVPTAPGNQEELNVAGPSKAGKKSVKASSTLLHPSTYRNAEALALQAMFAGDSGKKMELPSKGKIAHEEDNVLDKESLELALKLQREEAEVMAASNKIGPSNKKKRGPLDRFVHK